MTTTDLATMTPAEVDGELAKIWANAPLSQLADTQRSIGKYERFGKVPEYLLKRKAELQQRIEAVRETAEPFEAEWRRRGFWPRYFAVLGGHVHGHNCSTLRYNTPRMWCPQFSGLTEAEVVGKLNYVACTVCFPSAPVQPKGLLESVKAERDAKAAANKLEK